MLPMPFAGICFFALLTPLIEEFAKAYPLLYRHGETERSISALGLMVGLGSGISEFLVYALLVGVPVYIRLWEIFFHASTTAIVAFGIAKKRTWIFYPIAVSLHFANNFMALLGGSLGVIAATAIEVMSYLVAWRLYTRTREKNIN
jgi:RsiW-degrading membrane proteinase PrsW (M82 family)